MSVRRNKPGTRELRANVSRARGLWLSWLLCLLLVWVGGPLDVAAAPKGGARDYGVVTIDLRPERGEVPTHLCVVSEISGPRARKRLGELMQGTPDERGEVELNTALWPEFGRATDCSSTGVCAPKIRVPGARDDAGDFSVACATDGLEGTSRERDPRLLVLMLEHLEGSPPAIDSLNLAGGVATIGVQLDLSRVVVTARSLGGHYAAHDRSYHADVSDRERKIVLLSLSPRCAWTPMILPDARLSERDRPLLRLVAQGHELDPARCIGPLDGSSTLRAMVPPGDMLGRVEVDQKPAKDGSKVGRALSYRGQWRGRWPDELLELRPTRVNFRWRPPECIYPRGVCPEARLASGQHCTAIPDERGCAYQCPGIGKKGASEEISLPVEVTFEKSDPVQRWSDTLESSGQILTSYVDASRRYLSADLRRWDTSTPGSRVSHVELLLSDGGIRRYAVEGRRILQVRAPDASCELMRYRVVGDREHREMLAPVRDGKILLAPPEDSARLVSFGVSVLQGGGPSFFVLNETDDNLIPPTNFMGLIQLAVNFRPAQTRLPRLSWDFRIGGSLSQWGIYEGPVGTSEHRVDRRIAWVRFLSGLAAVVDLWPNVRASAGIDFGGSWPLKAESDLPGERYKFLLSPTLGLRVAVRRHVALEAQVRSIIGEQYARIDNVDPQSYPAISVIGLYGIRIAF